jgi:hypothetical protein
MLQRGVQTDRAVRSDGRPVTLSGYSGERSNRAAATESIASARAATLAAWSNDIAAGAIAAIVTLPVCIASGILAFAPLGPDYAAAGAAAGLCGAIVVDDHVVCYELLRDGFNRMLADHRAIATSLLTNLSRELARLLRRTSQDLRSRK